MDPEVQETADCCPGVGPGAGLPAEEKSGNGELRGGGLAEEYAALQETAALMDLSDRSRLCLTGADRQSYLNGQVTNNVRDLRVGQGCYAFVVNARGRVQTDLSIYMLPDEILLDFEPGYTAAVTRRLEQFIIAEDVQVVDAAPFYGMLSVQGPRSGTAIEAWGWGADRPSVPGDIRCWRREGWGDLYLACQPRLGSCGFDLFLPLESISEVARALETAVRGVGGLRCGRDAFEVIRVELGIPRFGVDVDETNLAPEAGVESRAICYSKGCYVGQEVIARIRTYGQVARQLKQLRLPQGLAALPGKGERLFRNGREVGLVTSAVHSVRHRSNLALGYVRREASLAGTELELGMPGGGPVQVL